MKDIQDPPDINKEFGEFLFAIFFKFPVGIVKFLATIVIEGLMHLFALLCAPFILAPKNPWISIPIGALLIGFATAPFTLNYHFSDDPQMVLFTNIGVFFIGAGFIARAIAGIIEDNQPRRY